MSCVRAVCFFTVNDAVLLLEHVVLVLAQDELRGAVQLAQRRARPAQLGSDVCFGWARDVPGGEHYVGETTERQGVMTGGRLPFPGERGGEGRVDKGACLTEDRFEFDRALEELQAVH